MSCGFSHVKNPSSREEPVYATGLHSACPSHLIVHMWRIFDNKWFGTTHQHPPLFAKMDSPETCSHPGKGECPGNTGLTGIPYACARKKTCESCIPLGGKWAIQKRASESTHFSKQFLLAQLVVCLLRYVSSRTGDVLVGGFIHQIDVEWGRSEL